jgi:hypothetical protein
MKLAHAILLVAPVALAAPVPASPKGVWRSLVKPKARFELPLVDAGPEDSVFVETYDVRKVGEADVARLRYRYAKGHDPKDGKPNPTWATQIAVTAAGVWFLDAKLDDAAVTAALAKSPSEPDSPKPYRATRQNGGRSLSIEDTKGGAIVCLRQDADLGCKDACAEEVCVSPQAGIVRLGGNIAPGKQMYVGWDF